MADSIGLEQIDPDRAYTTGEVAPLFRVDPKTVSRWAKTGRLRAFRTPTNTGRGHFRIRGSVVLELLRGELT